MTLAPALEAIDPQQSYRISVHGEVAFVSGNYSAEAAIGDRISMTPDT